MSNPLRLPAGAWTLASEPRIGPATRASLGRVTRAVLWAARRRTAGRDFNVFLTLARLGRLFPAHTVLVAQLLGKTRLSTAEKELAILRTAWSLGCAYEYSHHHRMADESGVPSEHVSAATDAEPQGLPPRVTAILVAVDELLAEQKLTESGLVALRPFCSDDEILELCMLVGHYVMVGMIINSACVQPEADFAVVVQ